MRPTQKSILLVSLCFLAGCRKAYVVPEAPMPPHTILLSQMMRELSARPGFTDALLKQTEGASKKGPALMTPKLIDELRKRILGSDWQGLDRFPGWTMREINPTVRTVGHFAGKNEKLEGASEVHPGAQPSSAQTKQFLDLGPYSLDKAETVSLDQPSTLPPFTTDGLVTELGAGVVRGDGPNDLAPEHAESQRLADVLNRLAANSIEHAQSFTAAISAAPQVRVPRVPPLGPGFAGSSAQPANATRPQDLIAALIATGHTVTVDDARYFANFGHFHYNGQDVMMPFYVDSEIAVPHSHNRALLVPAAHAEYEWHIHGPRINADISYYFGIDGKSEWRTMDTLDQAWVLKRNAHEYTGADAVEVTRLAGLFTVMYMHQHAARPKLPFGGYYALGVCQDGVSAIEKKMTGHVTLFPNTADSSLFDDPRDAEINALITAIPKDRAGKKPEAERIFGSLPTVPDANGHFSEITVPGLAEDLDASYAAWKNGSLERTYTPWQFVRSLLFVVTAFGLAMFAAARTHRFLNSQGRQR